MKSYKFFLGFLLVGIMLTMDVAAQSFYTGAIGVTQSNGGRTRIFSDNLTTRMIDRISILVGVSQTQVFDYDQDQGSLINAATVSSPLLSDFEVTSTINNSYSNLPPNVVVAINLYGWTNGGFILAKMNVLNNEPTTINAVIGLEIIPQVDGTYGGETVQWDPATQTVFMNKTKWAGIKLLSMAQTSLRVFEWFSGFANDSSFYSWLTQGTFDPPYTAGVEGAVAVLGTNPVELNPGQSIDFYFGIAVGTSQASCTDNINQSYSKYLIIVPVELTSFTAEASSNLVNLNWSTATETNNHGFEIQRKSADDETGWVTIAFKEGAGTTTEVQNYSYTDNVSNLGFSKVNYRLKQVDYNGKFSYSDVIEVAIVPEDLSLEQNYPNPFNPSTKISFSLPFKDNVTLKVFNSLGQEVSSLINSEIEAGYHEVNFNAANLPSGIYVYSLNTSKGFVSKKMMLIK
jgi:hypothetical protein